MSSQADLPKLIVARNITNIFAYRFSHQTDNFTTIDDRLSTSITYNYFEDPDVIRSQKNGICSDYSTPLGGMRAWSL
ncbi:Uncharacterised protein [uncultured archaeon]|nr:Uncharacterised protein [uncultured archaeon]